MKFLIILLVLVVLAIAVWLVWTMLRRRRGKVLLAAPPASRAEGDGGGR